MSKRSWTRNSNATFRLGGGVRNGFRAVALLCVMVSLDFASPRVLAQDTDTQRPLPLPTNDLPDFSQQLELLRKLQSVVRSKEEKKQTDGKTQQPTQQPDDSKSSDTSKPAADPGQLSQLQNALKGLADKLPPDFVPPSLDSIPKEDLKKAMENPAIRKSVQDMLRQFAKDGVIPPPAPPGQRDSSRMPLPPSDDSKSSDPDRGTTPPIEPGPSDPQDKDSDGAKKPSDGTSESQPKSESNSPSTPDALGKKDNGVPPSSLKSLQDFMNRLASQAPENKDREKNANGGDRLAPGESSTEPGQPANQPPEPRRTGPLRRRDPSMNPDRSKSITPPPTPQKSSDSTDNPAGEEPRGDSSSSKNDRKSPSDPFRDLQRSEESKDPSANSQPNISPEAQRRALQALQDVMKEIEQEEAASTPPSSSAENQPDDSGDVDDSTRSRALDMLRKLDERNRGDAATDNRPPARDADQASDLGDGDSLSDMPSVQEFLKEELERMKSTPPGGRAQQPSGNGRNGEEDSPSSAGPGTDRSAGSKSGNQRDRLRSGESMPQAPRQSPNSNLSQRSGMYPMQPAVRNDRIAEQMPQQRPNAGTGPQAGNRGSANPSDTRSSAENIRKELEQRGVMETLKKTWEKSVQESRERRKQEIQQKQMESQNAQNGGSEPSSDIEEKMSGLDQQLNSLAESIRNNPNAEKSVADMVERIAKDMSEQQRSRAQRMQNGETPASSGPSISERMNSDFPGKSMLKSIRETVSEALSDTRSSSPASSPSPIGDIGSGGSGVSADFDFTPILFLAGVLAAIALLFYGLRAVRFRETSATALAGVVPRLQPSEISTRADIVRAFHEMAVRTARSAQLWWTHRRVQNVLQTAAPEKQRAVETLVETYEQARYLPQELELSPDQIQSARSALQQLQS